MHPNWWGIPIRFIHDAVLLFFTAEVWRRPLMLVLFLSSFFTSIWVWLYALSGFAVKLADSGAR